MRTRTFLRALLSVLVLCTLSTAVHAQATRTWVSGVGNDANPCSRTAPCKTFAGAISKTAAFGQINVLDPGAFGAVTITKSITIDAGGIFAGVLATAGTSGIIVNALNTDVVILRGLTIDGANTGGNGIRFLAGGALHVESCVINGFAQKGLDIEPSNAGGTFLYVKDTIITNNNNVSTGGGILLKPSGSGSVRAELNNVRSERNTFGLRTENNTETIAVDSAFVGNTGIGGGINAVSTAGGNVQINCDRCTVSNNTQQGVTANGVNAIVRLSETIVTNNSSTGINPTSSGQVLTFVTNRVAGNNPNGTFTASSTAQQ
jgi:hypothetical protein